MMQGSRRRCLRIISETSYYDGDKYIQHNISIADGLSGLGAALEAMAKQGISMVYDKTHMVLALHRAENLPS